MAVVEGGSITTTETDYTVSVGTRVRPSLAFVSALGGVFTIGKRVRPTIEVVLGSGTSKPLPTTGQMWPRGSA